MGLLNFFNNSREDSMLDDLYFGLEQIANSSYKVFLESFDFNARNFGEATKFETYIAMLFYVDYCMVNQSISENIRKNFYELVKAKIIERFNNKLSNTDLSNIVDYRYYEEYSQIPMKVGKDWHQSFHNLYEIKLKGTENTDTIKKLPGIKTEDMDMIEGVAQKALFIRDETANIYKAAKLVKELFAGKKLHLIMKEIEEADIEIKQELWDEENNTDTKK